MTRGRLSRNTVLAAIVGSNGNHALIAMRLRRSVGWVKRTIEGDPILYKAWQEEVNTIVDYAEGVLMGHLAKGNLSAAMFVLNHRGKERGYGSNQTLTLRSDPDTPLGIVIMPAPPRTDLEAAPASTPEAEQE